MIPMGVITYNTGPPVVNSFKFQITTTAINEVFTLPILAGGASYTQNFTITWGDTTSSEITAYNDPDAAHTYAVAGTYDVEMIGTCQYLSFYSATAANRNKVKKLLAVSGDIGFKLLNFYNCANLNTLIPLGTMSSLLNANGGISGVGLFQNCTSITSIPSGIFDGCSAITDFSYAFYGCLNAALTSIPADLFKYNIKVTTFEQTFAACQKLVSVPADLFKYNTKVITFYRTFYLCQSLTTIGSGIFDGGILVTTFQQTFQGCALLTAIPDHLFDYNTAVTTFQNTFSTCSAITSIPTDLFKYNIAATTFFGTFFNCSGLTSIPSGLFDTNILVNTFASTFSGCNKITVIVADLFKYNTGVTTFANTFQNCSVLATIPADLFRYNTLALTFTSTFNACVKMQQRIDIFYPVGESGTRFLDKSVIFTNCFTRTSFTGTQGTAPDLWNCNFGSGTPTKTNCYSGAGNSITSLTNYADIPTVWKS